MNQVSRDRRTPTPWRALGISILCALSMSLAFVAGAPAASGASAPSVCVLPAISAPSAPLLTTAQVDTAFGAPLAYTGETNEPATIANPQAVHTCSWRGPALFKSSNPYNLNRVSLQAMVIGPFKAPAGALAGYVSILKSWGGPKYVLAAPGIGDRAAYLLAAQDVVTSQLVALWSRYVLWVSVGAPSSVSVKRQHAGEARIARLAIARISRPGSSSTVAVAGGSVKVSLPVVRCPTTYGVAPAPKPVALPATMTLRVPVSLAGRLAVYADGPGFTTLAPRGWRCSAGKGADASEALMVFPPGERAKSSTEEVDLSNTGLCAGCADGQACPLFSSAVPAARSLLYSCTANRAEKVVRLNAHIVAFEDPPHVKGDGRSSGGPNADDGVMTYYVAGDEPMSFLADCALPASGHLLCTAVLNQFIRWYGNERS